MTHPLLQRLNQSVKGLVAASIGHGYRLNGRRRAMRNMAEVLGSDLEHTTGELFERIAAPKIVQDYLEIAQQRIPRLTGEFWTAGQRQASSLHEISYRACFKPQLPRYFIKRFTDANDTVYDPFSGRGTSALEAGLMSRKVIANDVNPLSRILTEPRLAPPSLRAIEERLASIQYGPQMAADIDLSMFYDPRTEAEIVALKGYLAQRKAQGAEDDTDRWIRMVATNRLTGHSPGFFSVYTFPPNQAVSAESQKKINQKRNQKPDYRDTKRIILKKSKSLLQHLAAADGANLEIVGPSARFLTVDARLTKAIKKGSVQLTVTSPPFLDTVGYATDNWLRCWFNGVDVTAVSKNITMAKSVDQWCAVMGDVFVELYRITKRGGWVAFEVGELRNGSIKLEDHVIPLGQKAGFSCVAVMINSQAFTKTSHIWGIKNNSGGINSNRVVIFRR